MKKTHRKRGYAPESSPGTGQDRHQLFSFTSCGKIGRYLWDRLMTRKP